MDEVRVKEDQTAGRNGQGAFPRPVEPIGIGVERAGDTPPRTARQDSRAVACGDHPQAAVGELGGVEGQHDVGAARDVATHGEPIGGVLVPAKTRSTPGRLQVQLEGEERHVGGAHQIAHGLDQPRIVDELFKAPMEVVAGFDDAQRCAVPRGAARRVLEL